MPLQKLGPIRSSRRKYSKKRKKPTFKIESTSKLVNNSNPIILEPENARGTQEKTSADRGPVVILKKNMKGAKSLGANLNIKASKAHTSNDAPTNFSPEGDCNMMKGLRRLTLSKTHQRMDGLYNIMKHLKL